MEWAAPAASLGVRVGLRIRSRGTLSERPRSSQRDLARVGRPRSPGSSRALAQRERLRRPIGGACGGSRRALRTGRQSARPRQRRAGSQPPRRRRRRSLRVTVAADQSRGRALQVGRRSLADAMRELRHSRKICDFLNLREEVIRQRLAGLRGARFQCAVESLGHVPDLDDPCHARHVIAGSAHAAGYQGRQ